ncbi:MAG: hypothetical protein IPJ62_05830 [Betaproteobacteria bacterium]|nr:hypothetical protein [Betaproteobacteria bacterium]
MVREFALPVTPADFLAAFAHWPRSLYPGVPELLAALAPRYRLASVSNTNALHWDRFCAPRAGFSRTRSDVGRARRDGLTSRRRRGSREIVAPLRHSLL